MAKNGNIHPTRLFREPDELYAMFEQYKEHLKQEATKWPKVQYVGKNGNRVVDFPPVPYTFEGFCNFTYNKVGEISQYFSNPKREDGTGYYDDFINICSRIKREIRENQVTGGMLGFYNPSITQRLNGLVEKSSVEVKAEQPLFPDKKD